MRCIIVRPSKCIIIKNFIEMIKTGNCIRVIVSDCSFQDYFKGNRILVDGIQGLDSMTVSGRYDCSKVLCVHIDEPMPKTQIELAIHRFVERLNNAGVIGAYSIHPMGVPLVNNGVQFFDILSIGNTIKQFRYNIDYISVK